jgi:hypothetical protein
MEKRMKKGWKITLIVLASLLVLVLLGPFPSWRTPAR